jgi:hypothetical protein
MTFKSVLRFLFSFAPFFAGWMLAESGTFGYPGLWLMDATSNQFVKAVGATLALILTFGGFGIFCLPLIKTMGLIEESQADS